MSLQDKLMSLSDKSKNPRGSTLSHKRARILRGEVQGPATEVVSREATSRQEEP